LALILLFDCTGVRIWHLPPFVPHTPISGKSALRESACRVDLLPDGHRRSKKIIPVGDAAIAATAAEQYIESARARSGKEIDQSQIENKSSVTAGALEQIVAAARA
jgi:hypothetical protein